MNNIRKNKKALYKNSKKCIILEVYNDFEKAYVSLEENKKNIMLPFEDLKLDIQGEREDKINKILSHNANRKIRNRK